MKKFVLCMLLVLCVSLCISCNNEKNNDYFNYKKNMHSFVLKYQNENETEYKEENINVNITEILKNDTGILYRFETGVTHSNSIDYYCFFVTRDKIYRVEYTDININKIKNDEDINEIGVVVCQEDILEDKIKNKKGQHYYITLEGDNVECYIYNDQVETGYFESYIWKKDEGLIKYRRGIGADKELFEISR